MTISSIPLVKDDKKGAKWERKGTKFAIPTRNLLDSAKAISLFWILWYHWWLSIYQYDKTFYNLCYSIKSLDQYLPIFFNLQSVLASWVSFFSYESEKWDRKVE